MVQAGRGPGSLPRSGAPELALMYVVLAVPAGLLSTLGTRLGRRVACHAWIVVTHAVVAASLLAAWLALRARLPGTAWILYVWSSFFGLFVIANFWLLANTMFDARAARRLFPLLGAGAIAGGAAGGQAATLARR